MAFTFKDSEVDKTYYKDYNKVDGQQSVLIGNWQEERSLKELTGQMRSTQWVAPSSSLRQADIEPVHSKMKGHPDMEDTTMRVFFHSEYIEPQDFKPASQMFREDKWRRYESQAKGARTQLMERRARELAEAQLETELNAKAGEHAAEESKGRVSEAQATFVGYAPARADDPGRGKRIMKTQDGAPAYRDAQFLVDVGILQPHLARDVHTDPASLPNEPRTYVDDMYVPGQTKGDKAQTFRKTRNDDFSKPIELSMKAGVFLDD